MELAFAWYSAKTNYGQTYVSFCRIEIQKRNEQWLKRELKIDSGADMTLLEKHDLSTLGYTPDDREGVDVENITEKKSPASMRRFNIKIGDFIINDVPIAFSDKPVRNLLLGRAKIFESINILFHKRTRHTILSNIGG
jgi:Aspartyl protease